MNEVAKEKLPHYVMSATAEIGRIAAGAVSGDVKTTAGRRDVISSIKLCYSLNGTGCRFHTGTFAG